MNTSRINISHINIGRRIISRMIDRALLSLSSSIFFFFPPSLPLCFWLFLLPLDSRKWVSREVREDSFLKNAKSRRIATDSLYSLTSQSSPSSLGSLHSLQVSLDSHTPCSESQSLTSPSSPHLSFHSLSRRLPRSSHFPQRRTERVRQDQNQPRSWWCSLWFFDLEEGWKIRSGSQVVGLRSLLWNLYRCILRSLLLPPTDPS